MPSFLTLIQPEKSAKINHLRAIAAFWIFVFHYYQFISYYFFLPLASINPFLLLIYHGYFCVYLFFVLSGFLLSKAYQDKLVLKTFFIKRVGRIFPAYYLCILVYALLYAQGTREIDLLFHVFNFDLAVYPGPIGHLWFINRLLECYLCFPLLWWLMQKTGRAGLLIIYLLCLFGGGYWVILSRAPLPLYYTSFVLCLSQFILGILAAHQTNNSRPLQPIITLLIFASILVWFHQDTWQTPLAYAWSSIIWFNTAGLFFAMLIRAYLTLPIYLPHFISLMLKKFGDISYSFYLYHFLVIHFFIHHREFLYSYKVLGGISLFLMCIILAVFFQNLLTTVTRCILTIKRAK